MHMLISRIYFRVGDGFVSKSVLRGREELNFIEGRSSIIITS